MRRLAILAVLLMVLSVSATAVATDKGHGSMPGMSGEKSMEGHGSMPGMKGEASMQGHGMTAMGEKVYEGKIGPWKAEGRLVDMKAQMEKAKASKEMMAKMKHTHHLMFSLEDSAAKKQVAEGKGTVTVTGPDKQQAKYDLVVMEGHFGSDITLKTPGKYTFSAEVESGGKKGADSFNYTVK